MITWSDREYQVTKRIKQRKAKLAPPFDELAEWITAIWDVTVLNVVYDQADDLHGPRLQVILEHLSDLQAFRDAYDIDAQKEQAIIARFVDIVNGCAPNEYNRDNEKLSRWARFVRPINRRWANGYDIDGLFVVFSAFAPLAREEADSKISDTQVEMLKQKNSSSLLAYR